MKIKNSIEELNFNDIYNSYGEEYYIKDIMFSIGRGWDRIKYNIILIDLNTNIKYSGTLKEGADIKTALYNKDISAIVDNLYTEQLNARNVYNPFKKLNNWTKEPAKWTKNSIVKAYYNNKIVSVKTDFYYTDDYALDYANNYSKDIKLNIDAAMKKLIEWTHKPFIYKDGEDDNYYYISYSYHSNHSDTVIIRK